MVSQKITWIDPWGNTREGTVAGPRTQDDRIPVDWNGLVVFIYEDEIVTKDPDPVPAYNWWDPRRWL